MLTALLLEIALVTVLCIFFGRRYKSLKESEYEGNKAMRLLLPAAAILADMILIGRFHSYESRLSAKLSELYGSRFAREKLRLFLAKKLVYMITAILALTFLGAFMDASDTGCVVFAAAVLLLVFYLPDRAIEEKIKKRSFYIRYDFPDFLNKLVLLINAGMTVNRAWEKIVCDRKNMTPLYEELNTTYMEIRNGKAEEAAYEDFARRCRVKEITKFTASIIQNLKKGNGELVVLLKLQSNECWQLRKNMARRLGEEASTKLVLPLMIMFVGILAIVMLPALMQLRYL